jgi:acyl-CoA reductase-like NAD-dependent aldehyde dehydrogenase
MYDKIYINGKWVASAGDGFLNVINASTEEVMGQVPNGTTEDIDRAVEAAQNAFESWAATPVTERAAALRKIVEGMQARTSHIARTITGEVGMPLGLSTAIQVGLPVSVASSYVDLAPAFPWEEEVGNSLILREPVGVVGCITPWNYPLHQLMGKVAPALVAGCTVVVKPSQVAPLSIFILAEIVHEAGLPPGVFNLVSGAGSVIGEAIASHPGVDMVSLTGSTVTGRRVAELAAATIKHVHLELGGKSANIILDDADFAQAVPGSMFACYLNAGQTCSALTRLLVPRTRHDEAMALAKAATERFVVGDPYTPGTQIGPLASAAQREIVVDYIRKGIEEGATLVTGGLEPPDGLDKGYYVRPTVFANVTPSMLVAQEEIFGPVLCIMPFEDEDDAVRIANSTMYGLSGAVRSGDIERAKRVARRLRTGGVDINGGTYNILAPFGGYKQSGIGRERGRYGLESFLEVKSLQLPQY